VKYFVKFSPGNWQAYQFAAFGLVTLN